MRRVGWGMGMWWGWKRRERKREREKKEIHQTCKFSDAEHVLCKFASLPLLRACPWLCRAGRWASGSGPSFPRKASLISVCLARIGMCALHLTTYALTTLPGLGEMVGDLLVVTCMHIPRTHWSLGERNVEQMPAGAFITNE